MWGHFHDRHRAFAAAIAAAAMLAVPGIATATAATSSTTSANWSGYAAHGNHARFRRATGIWRVPKLTCVHGRRTYSAVWVGIGGFALNARALEQTGTETDCKRDGSTTTTAWFEVVPAPSRTIQLKVSPGDLISAAVMVNGLEVSLTLRDLTTHRRFTKVMIVRHPDTSSAEWIVEAPSNCASSGGSCRTLPLADFGTVRFTHATVQMRGGRTTGIATRRWRTTEILLRTRNGSGFAAVIPDAKAIPSVLGAAREAFSVVYQALSVTTSAATP